MASQSIRQSARRLSKTRCELSARQVLKPWTGLILSIACAGLMLVLAGCSGYTAASPANQPAAPAPQITTSSMPGGTVATAYSTTLAATGGTTPYTWSITSGSLPAGISLASSTGVVSGTPTAAGNASFTVKVTDAQSKTATQALSISVAAAGGSPTISTSSLPGGTAGTAYSATVQATGGTTPYTWSVSSGSLPTGLTLTASSGAISGTPTASGTSSFTVKVVDANSNAATKQLSITISTSGPQPLAITTSALPQGSTSTAYSANLQASGGTPPYTWSVASGSLPGGLSLAGSSGVISGTPSAAGSSSFTIQVKDSASTPATAQKALTLTVVTGVALDQYGGRTNVQCSTAGKWTTQEINNQWWICTPAGHGMFLQDIEYIASVDSTSDSAIAGKYGSMATWSEETLKRMSNWRFNTVGVYSYNELWPITTDNSFPVDSNGYHSHSVKLPFFSEIRPSFYSMSNPSITLWTGGTAQFLSDPVKNIFGAVSPVYNDYVPGGGVGDYFDSKMQTWMNDDISQDWNFGYIKNGPYSDYLIGIIGDDGDELTGMATGPDFPTVPPAHNNPSLSLLVLTESPIQTANSGMGFVYADSTMYSKKALHDRLVTEYGSISALNSAWGSSYTTFDSSGTCVGSQPVTCAANASADAVGTGNGSTLTFAATLSHTTISADSLSVYVGSTRVAGDLGNGTLYGPNISTGSINYSTGALSVTFASGHAPGSGVTVTAGYVANGWGIGTGLMDEDMRLTHQLWLGNTWDGLYAMLGGTLVQMNPGVSTDLNAYLKSSAEWYFQMLVNGVHSQFPNTLVDMGLSGWSGMPPGPVLQAAGEYLDIIENDDTAGTWDQAHLNFLAQNYGNKPTLVNVFFAANPDSNYGNGGNPPTSGEFQTQAQKGQAYASTISTLLGAKTSSGTDPYVGIILWDWMDNEGTNWGLVSHLDNAYDGHEDVSSSVTCSAPLQQYTCGGEPGNYGNAITPIQNANQLWLTH